MILDNAQELLGVGLVEADVVAAVDRLSAEAAAHRRLLEAVGGEVAPDLPAEALAHAHQRLPLHIEGQHDLAVVGEPGDLVDLLGRLVFHHLLHVLGLLLAGEQAIS